MGPILGEALIIDFGARKRQSARPGMEIIPLCGRFNYAVPWLAQSGIRNQPISSGGLPVLPSN